MSRYKVLVAGKNESLIDELFGMNDPDVEFLTCSARAKDISSHIDSVYPSVFLFCPLSERADSLAEISASKNTFKDADVRIAVAGNAYDVKDFADTCGHMEDGDFINPDVYELVDGIVRVANGEIIDASAELAKLDKAATPAPAPARTPVRAATPTPAQAEMIEDVDDMLAGMLEKRHVLVVDDDPIMLKTISNTLEGTYNVATAVNGKVALKFLEKKKTDLILLDYEMPMMDGPTVLAEIRKSAEWAKLPVIFLTGISDAASIKQVLALGPQGYLLKPVDKDKLLATIKDVIYKK